jgi:hypothetical protein
MDVGRESVTGFPASGSVSVCWARTVQPIMMKNDSNTALGVNFRCIPGYLMWGKITLIY